MAGAAGKIGWKIVAAAFAVPMGIAVRKAMETGWRKAKHDDPPKNPAAPGTAWSEALIWAAASGSPWRRPGCWRPAAPRRPGSR